MSAPLDPSLTASFTLGSSTSKSAVLVLHGFTGSPWEVRPVAEALAARGAYVSVPRLPGHGTVPEAMLWAGWRDWVNGAEAAFAQLERFERVFVAGLSMGGLLAMILASRHPTRVAKLALMAPAVKLRATSGRLLRVVRHRKLELVRSGWLTKTSTDIEDDEARAQSPMLERYPIARLLDLFTLQDVAHLSVPLITAPTLIAAAVNDHVVALDGLQKLHRSMPTSRFLLLQRGFHILPRDTDRALLLSEISSFFA